MSALVPILRYWLLLSLCGLAFVAQARQTPASVPSLASGLAEYQVEVWRDTNGAITLADLLQTPRDFAVLPLRGLSAGYSRDAHWMRIRVRKLPDAPNEWHILIDTAHLDDVRMFIPRQSGNLNSDADYLEYRMGDRTPMSARPLNFNAPLAGLEIPDTEPRWIYIRIQTSGSLVAFPEVLAHQNFTEQAQYKLMTMFLFFGMLITMLMMSSLYAIWLRDKSIAMFALLLLAQLFGHSSVEGYFGQILVPESPLIADKMVGFSGNTGYAIGTLLFTYMTNLRSYFPRLFPFQLAASAYFALVALSSLTPFYSDLAEVGRILLIPVALAIFASAIKDTQHKGVGSIYIALSYGVLVALIGYSSVRLLGLVTGEGNAFVSQSLAVLAMIILLQIGIVTRAHQAQRHRQDSAFRWQRAMEDVERERDLRETQSQFLHMVSHEVRTPLAVMSAATTTLRLVVDEFNPIVTERIDRIENAVQRMERLFDMCLNAERIERDQRTPERHATNLVQLIQDIAADPTKILTNRLVIHDATQGREIQADRRLLAIAFANLLGNAVKYAPADTPITLDITPTEESGVAGVRIAMTDSGPGIAEELLERVFEKHFRANELNNTPGLGLGLYLSRQIINDHRGRITALPGPGGRFEIFLPEA